MHDPPPIFLKTSGWSVAQLPATIAAGNPKGPMASPLAIGLGKMLQQIELTLEAYIINIKPTLGPIILII